MTADRDLTPYCAAPRCDLNLAGWAHVPWDCDTTLPAPTLAAETVAALPVDRWPWVQGSARAFARLNPDLLAPQQPGEELPGELATDPRQHSWLREQEATATLGERGDASLRAENASPEPVRRRAVIAERAEFARLHAVDRDLLLQGLARLPEGTSDLSERSVLDQRFAAFLLSDHPAAVAERCRRRAAYLDDVAREREVLLGWLAKLDRIPPRPGERFDDAARRMAATTRRLLDEQAARLRADLGEPDQVRVARARDGYETRRQASGYRAWRYPARYRGRPRPASPSHPNAQPAPSWAPAAIATGQAASFGPEGGLAMNAELTAAVGQERCTIALGGRQTHNHADDLDQGTPRRPPPGRRPPTAGTARLPADLSTSASRPHAGRPGAAAARPLPGPSGFAAPALLARRPAAPPSLPELPGG